MDEINRMAASGMADVNDDEINDDDDFDESDLMVKNKRFTMPTLMTIFYYSIIYNLLFSNIYFQKYKFVEISKTKIKS